jgi:DNA-directed RNA polymerase subunit RPC12/RpoP
MTNRRRLLRCPQCGHQGAVGRHVSIRQKVRCRACGLKGEVRNFCGGRPVRLRPPNSAAAMKSAAARDVLSRFSPIPESGDAVPEL